ncbi:hypothetical protein [Acrocarpospora catenulata]|uniref:hypothetical protein n=1 Tax=Acrocarpospora catenulata TaxID=2836182 RepID=UPI001BDA3F32|nr:hypothetical protein [Acrocarpospora catenulata]
MSGISHERRPVDIGVITGTPVEMGAVRDVLDLGLAAAGGLLFYEGTVRTRGTTSRIAALQARDSVAAALGHLLGHFRPGIVVLTGTAEATDPGLAAGDVVVCAEAVVDGPGTGIGHAVAAFFGDYGDPAHWRTEDARGVSRAHRVLPGPVGTAKPAEVGELTQGWAVIQGITPPAAGETHRRVAAWHAAAVLQSLIPYLRLTAR